jgi:hypothetical protein
MNLWGSGITVSPIQPFEEFGPGLTPATMFRIELQGCQAIVVSLTETLTAMPLQMAGAELLVSTLVTVSGVELGTIDERGAKLRYGGICADGASCRI